MATKKKAAKKAALKKVVAKKSTSKKPERSIVDMKTHTVRVFIFNDGTTHMTRDNRGFSVTELAGLWSLINAQLVEQMTNGYVGKLPGNDIAALFSTHTNFINKTPDNGTVVSAKKSQALKNKKK